MLNYKSYRLLAETGDMVCFSGVGLASVVIKAYTRSQWSHVGMVIKSSEWDMVLCWESTLLCKTPDIETGFVKKGVMLVPLRARILTYDGLVGIRRIKEPLTDVRLGILKAFRHEVKNRPYEKDYIELVKSGYDGPFGKNTQDLSSIFCSEGVAEPCIRMGLISDELPSNEYTPADLIEGFSSVWGSVLEIG